MRIGEQGLPATAAEAAARNVVDNNFIQDGGKIYHGAVGVWIGQSSYHTVSHNEICDLDYTGVSVGWSWGYAPSSANHNLIEFNHIHDIGRGVMDDMGGIYTLGISPGTVERGNLIHDIKSHRFGGWGIYTDEGSSDILIENNIVYNTVSGGFHQHYGRNNIVRNNIFAFAVEGQLRRSRNEEHVSFAFERNLVLTVGAPLLYAEWGNGWYRLDHNLYWDYADPEPEFFGGSFAEWQAQGRDQHSLVADSGFLDAFHYDFRLAPGSHALAMGFQPIDAGKAGLYGEESWRMRPARIKRPPRAPYRLEQQPIAEDFESTSPGVAAPGAVTVEEGAATARVTEETAAAGRRSLKVTDVPGLKQAFNPHVYYTPSYISGTARESFDLRVEPGTAMYHEWRDPHSPYRIGPSFAVNERGEVIANKRPVARIEPGKWMRFLIVCPLGKQARGAWDLTIVPSAGGAAQTLTGLACDPKFRSLSWLGWVASADQSGVFYLDNVELGA